MASTDDSDFVEELPFPVPFSFLSNLSQNVMMLYTSAKFFRTIFNDNCEVAIPIGNNYAPTLWYSFDTYLPASIFNSTKPISEVSFPSQNAVQINDDLKFYHDIQIDFELSKNSSRDGYQNTRKIQCLPVRYDGSPYDDSMVGYKQPGPNFRDTLSMQGEINHVAGDVVRLKFNLMQDNGFADQSDTLMTIYRITWNMCALKIG